MAMCKEGFVKGQGNWVRGYWRIQAKDYGGQDGEMQMDSNRYILYYGNRWSQL